MSVGLPNIPHSNGQHCHPRHAGPTSTGHATPDSVEGVSVERQEPTQHVVDLAAIEDAVRTILSAVGEDPDAPVYTTRRAGLLACMPRCSPDCKSTRRGTCV